MVYLGLENPKDAGNVGSVLRALGCYQADGIFYTGSRYDRAVKHSTDTRNVAEKAQMSHVGSLLLVKEQLPDDTRLICVELVVGATPIFSMQLISVMYLCSLKRLKKAGIVTGSWQK
jgi:tRNA(Leu) C34 or U34 (ribose-2'-O)-methylase TrmL